MTSKGTPESEKVKLPWSYALYQIIAILEFLIILIIATWALLTYPSTILIFEYATLIPILLFATYGLVQTCQNLKTKGRITKIAWLINMQITSYSPPQKLHRFILGSYLIDLMIGGTLIIALPQTELPILITTWIFIALGIIGLFITLSALLIPDQKPPQVE